MRLLLASLVVLVLGACAPAAPPHLQAPSASPPSAPEPPATFAYYLDYEPFTLGLRRNGSPFQGRAMLVGPQLDEELHFEEGKATLSAALLERIERVSELHLDVEGQSIILLPSGARRAFQCAREIEALRGIDPCVALLPAEQLVPEDCDPPGQRGWLSVHAASQARYQACYASASPEAIARLQTAPTLAEQTCPRWLGALGASPPEEIAVALWPVCRSYFPPPLLAKTEHTYLLKGWPQTLARAESAGTQELEQLYNSYLRSLPGQAEELRKIAIRRLAPPGATEARWKALQVDLERMSSDTRRYELCGAEGELVQLRVLSPQMEELKGGAFLGLLAKPRRAERLILPTLLPAEPTAQDRALLERTVGARVGKRKLVFSPNCAGKRLWFFRM